MLMSFFSRFKRSRAPVRRVAKRGRVAAYAATNRWRQTGPRSTGNFRLDLKEIRAFMNKMKPEKKYADVSLALTDVVDANGGVVHLTAIAQGDTASTRTGHNINVTDLVFGVNLDRGGSVSAGVNSALRWAIVQHKLQVSDTSPVATDIFQAADPVNPRPVIANLENFKVLYISDVILPTMAALDSDITAPATMPNVLNWEWHGSINVGYNDTASTDIEKNGIYFVLLTVNTASTIDVSGTCRIGFTDA